MATSSPSTSTPGADLLEFCLSSWTGLDGNSLTEEQTTQAGKVATLLTSAKRFQALDRFVGSVPDSMLAVFLQNEQFRRALIELRRHQGRHADVCQLIQDGTFSAGADLVAVWDMAHYALWEQQYRKPLSALVRFRIRKRNPPPPSICKDGRSTRNLAPEAKCVLRDWLKDNQAYPYPDRAEREQLRQNTGLTHTQIRTWFANARRRRQQKRQRITPPEKKAGGGGSKPRQPQPRVKRKSSSVSLGPGGVVPSPGGEARQRSEFFAQTAAAVPPASRSSQYLQLSPGGPSSSDHTGLQGLVCMYSRLPIRGSAMPTTSPSSARPFFCSHEQGPSPPTAYAPHHSRHTPGRQWRSPLWEGMSGPLLIQTPQPAGGEGEGRRNPGGSLLSPVVMTTPSWTTTTPPTGSDTGHAWDTFRSPPVLWQPVEPALVLNGEQFSGQLRAVASPPSVEAGTTTRKRAVATETLTAMPATSVWSQQRHTRDARMAGAPAGHAAGAQAPGLRGVHVPEVKGALIRDQCLAMWNTSTWLAAHSPVHLFDAGPVDSASDLLHWDLHYPNRTLTDGASSVTSTVSTAELSGPKALDISLVLQPAPKPQVAGPAQHFAENIFPAQSLILDSTEDVDDEAAHILLDLASTSKP